MSYTRTNTRKLSLGPSVQCEISAITVLPYATCCESVLGLLRVIFAVDRARLRVIENPDATCIFRRSNSRTARVQYRFHIFRMTRRPGLIIVTRNLSYVKRTGLNLGLFQQLNTLNLSHMSYSDFNS